MLFSRWMDPAVVTHSSPKTTLKTVPSARFSRAPTHHDGIHVSVSVRHVSFYKRCCGDTKFCGLVLFSGLEITVQKLPG